VSLTDDVPRRLIVLSFDSLATAAVGCYGSSWNQTPAIDAIASGGVVWDRLHVTDDRSDRVLRRWFESGDDGWAGAWRPMGSRELITDNDAVGRDASGFDHIVTIAHDEPQTGDVPAPDIESTRLASLIAAAIERDADEAEWSVMWLHSDFLSHAWDAPRSLFPIDEVELDRGEPDEFGDSTPSASFLDDSYSDDSHSGQSDESVPQPIFGDVVVPRVDLRQSDDDDPDRVTAWMRTYGCQVRLIDWMIEVLLGSLRVDDPIVVVVGTGGFSLGQNGWIGRHAGPLRSPEIRVPLIVSDVGPIRMPAITSTDFLPELLRDLAVANSPNRCWSPERWVAVHADDAVRTESARASVAVTTPQWFFVADRDGGEHLYLKPDDTEDFNDIARLRPDVTDSLR
jgi:hypothetical protein